MARPSTTSHSPPPGAYPPSILFFHSSPSSAAADDPTNPTPDPINLQPIDYPSTASHLLRLAHAGVTGILIHGSNGEAMHLSREERKAVIAFARRTLDDAGFGREPDTTTTDDGSGTTTRHIRHVPLMAGTGAESLQETLRLCADAAEAGAQWCLVLPPSFWRAAMGAEVLRAWFLDVAKGSPLPIMIYNFPAVRAGIDLDSGLIGELAAEMPGKIVGTKLSDANVGKLNRLGAWVARERQSETVPGREGVGFRAYVGRSDAMLSAVLGGGCCGVIGALVNLAPRTHMRVWTLTQRLLCRSSPEEGFDAYATLREARQLQALLAEADGALGKLGGVAGLKAAVAACFEYGRAEIEGEDGHRDVVAVVRKPLRSLGVQTTMRGELGEVLSRLRTMEENLETLEESLAQIRGNLKDDQGASVTQDIRSELLSEEHKYRKLVSSLLYTPWAPGSEE